MLKLYAATVVALVAIVALSGWEAVYSDRFKSSSVTAEEFGKRFANVPKDVGPWHGTDMEAEKDTLEMAGAVNHVSRRYVNSETQDSVDLWLIVGHSRDISRHTPDICYPSQGFSPVGARLRERIDPADESEPQAWFFTSKFRNESALGGHLQRVFWAWNGNTEGQDQWEAPEAKSIWSWLPFKSSGPKVHYGNNTALYKMYFTSAMSDADEEVSKSAAYKFAEVMLPEINRALFPERYKDKPRETDASAPAPDAAAAEAAAAIGVEPPAAAAAVDAAPVK